MKSPSASSLARERRPGRRNHTRQRERLLALLKASKTHPNANELFERLQREFPRLSLGTVYRNLEVLVAEGVVFAVESTDSVVRYDGNTQPHHHFLCDACGAIRDIELPEPRGLRSRLERQHGLRARRIRIGFHGLCKGCADREL